MNNLNWKDLETGGIKVLVNNLKPVFKELLPELSNHSFQYHLFNYLKQVLDLDNKEYIEEEKQRFREYIKRIYKL